MNIPDPTRPKMIIHTGFQWNYTTVLNILALAVFAAIYWLYRHRDTTSGRYAKDPVCGMQVETEHAPASRMLPDGMTYFCSDHCAHRFDADPQRFPRTPRTGPTTDTEPGPSAASDDTGHDSAVDPVCGMNVDPATAAHSVEHDGHRYVFCGPGCRTAFQAAPEAYLPAAAPDRDDVNTLPGGAR